jgi:hypothetical protein
MKTELIRALTRYIPSQNETKEHRDDEYLVINDAIALTYSPKCFNALSSHPSYCNAVVYRYYKGLSREEEEHCKGATHSSGNKITRPTTSRMNVQYSILHETISLESDETVYFATVLVATSTAAVPVSRQDAS